MKPPHAQPDAPQEIAVGVTLATTLGGIGAAAWALLVVAVALTAPRFELVYTDFGVALPLATLFFIRLATRWPLLLLVVLAAAGLGGLAIARRWWPLALALCLGAGAAWLLFVLAMFVPLMTMINSLGSAGP